jgi:hypothetical protein
MQTCHRRDISRRERCGQAESLVRTNAHKFARSHFCKRATRDLSSAGVVYDSIEVRSNMLIVLDSLLDFAKVNLCYILVPQFSEGHRLGGQCVTEIL